MPISYMVHQTQIIHSRKNKPRYKQMSFYVSCVFFFADLERRAIASFTATCNSKYHTCYTKHIHPIFDNSHLDKTHTPLYFIHLLARRNEKESYRKCYTNNVCIYHTCYTTHIQSVISRIVLRLEMRR